MVLLKITPLCILSLLGVCQCYVRRDIIVTAESAPIVKDADNNLKDAVYWTQWKGKIPDDALVAGMTQNDCGLTVPLYVGQASIKTLENEEMTLPVQIFSYSKYVEAPYDRGLKYVHKSEERVQVLCTRDKDGVEWVHYGKLNEKTRDKDCVVGGQELDNDKLYIGRINYDGVLKVGKVHFGNNAIYFPEGDEEMYSNQDFEVLCYKKPIVDKTVLKRETKDMKENSANELSLVTEIVKPETRETFILGNEVLMQELKNDQGVSEGVKVEVPGTTLSLKKPTGLNIFNWSFYKGSSLVTSENNDNKNEKILETSITETPMIYWKDFHGAPAPEDAVFAGKNAENIAVFVGQADGYYDSSGQQPVGIFNNSPFVTTTFHQTRMANERIKVLCTNVKPNEVEKFLKWIPSEEAHRMNQEKDLVVAGYEFQRYYYPLYPARGYYKGKFVVGKAVPHDSFFKFYFPVGTEEISQTGGFEILGYTAAYEKLKSGM